MQILHKHFQKSKEEKVLSHSFSKTRITCTNAKIKQWHYKKANYRSVSIMNTDENFSMNSSKLNLAIYKRDNKLQQSGVHSSNEKLV